MYKSTITTSSKPMTHTSTPHRAPSRETLEFLRHFARTCPSERKVLRFVLISFGNRNTTLAN